MKRWFTTGKPWSWQRQFSDSLAHVEKALENPQPGPERACLLALQSLILHSLGRDDEARTAFRQAERHMEPRLLDRNDREGFFTHEDRTYLIFRREAQALPGQE